MVSSGATQRAGRATKNQDPGQQAPAQKESGRETSARGDPELNDELGAQLVRFARLVHRAGAEVTKSGPDGVERAAYAILFHLVHAGPQRTSKLAEALHAEVSTISRQSSSLVQHGLVERTVDPEDGRACLLRTTAEGQRVFEENRARRNRWLADLLGDWSRSDQQTFIELLDRFNGAVEQHAPELAVGATAPTKKGDS